MLDCGGEDVHPHLAGNGTPAGDRASDAGDGDLPSDEQAIADSRDWLRKASLLPPDIGDGTVQAALTELVPQRTAARLALTWANSFPNGYRTAHSGAEAAADILRFDALEDAGSRSVRIAVIDSCGIQIGCARMRSTRIPSG